MAPQSSRSTSLSHMKRKDSRAKRRLPLCSGCSTAGAVVQDAIMVSRRVTDSSTAEGSEICDALLVEQFRGTGKFLDRYKLVEAIGEGSSSTVWKCQDKSAAGETWAVKVVRTTREVDGGQGTNRRVDSSNNSSTTTNKRTMGTVSDAHRSKRDSVLQEISVMATVQGCPTIPQFREFFEEADGRPASGHSVFYVVSELATGGNLLFLTQDRGSLPEEDARAVFSSLLRSCIFMKDVRVVHRDIKLDNLVLSRPHDFHSPAKLVDFGLAKILKQDECPTQICGTPYYVAPEILEYAYSKVKGTADSQQPTYSFEADMWSAGVALFILLSGCYPFADDHIPTLYSKIRHGNFDFSDPAWAMVDESAQDLILGCLTVDPAKRLTADQALNHPWVTMHS